MRNRILALVLLPLLGLVLCGAGPESTVSVSVPDRTIVVDSVPALRVTTMPTLPGAWRVVQWRAGRGYAGTAAGQEPITWAQVQPIVDAWQTHLQNLPSPPAEVPPTAEQTAQKLIDELIETQMKVAAVNAIITRVGAKPRLVATRAWLQSRLTALDAQIPD